MSDVLLDNSYLHSAYRCLIKRATSNNDIVNFYRLLAEIISHKIIYIKVNKDGPVIEKAIEIIDFFKNKSNKKFEIQFVDSKKNRLQSLDFKSYEPFKKYKYIFDFQELYSPSR